MRFVVFSLRKGGNGPWRWMLASAEGKPIMESAGTFQTKRGARRAIERLRLVPWPEVPIDE